MAQGRWHAGFVPVLHFASSEQSGLHHYTAIAKLGYPTSMRCWCGAVKSRLERWQEWYMLHDQCAAPVQEVRA
jgi:hypothetical protein